VEELAADRACRETVLQPPVDHPYGEREYVVRDPGGHRWTFAQTLRDTHPREWGDDDVVLKRDR
jgi:uncharacterized glyoxalase superfamily protein PhnB